MSRLTFTLMQMGYLTYSPTTGRYALSVGVLAFSNAYLGNLDVRNIARPLMQELADGIPATVSLGAPDPSSQHMVYLEICQGVGQMFRISMDVGSRVPHGWTAMGRAYLAALSPEEREQRLEHVPQRHAAAPVERDPAGYRPRRARLRAPRLLPLGGRVEQGRVGRGHAHGLRGPGRILAFNISGPIFDITRQKIVHEVGPRLLALRDRVAASTGGSFSATAGHRRS